MFAMKTSQKSAFYPREIHIHAWLNITVLYTIILDFEIYRVLAQDPKRLAIGFTEKHLFVAKIGRKSVFHLCEVDILARLDIIFLCIEKSKFWLKN
jgi:hypothetical protein